jgi:hypothetical protein
VTRSGSNRFEGSTYGYFNSQSLTGKDSTGSRATAFSDTEAGFTLGGAILRDRLAFFGTAGIRRSVFPQTAPAIGTDTTGGRDSVGIGIHLASALRGGEQPTRGLPSISACQLQQHRPGPRTGNVQFVVLRR